MDLAGYEATAAADLVRSIDDRLTDDWQRHDTGPGLWSWRTSRDERTLVVAVNALEDRVLVPVGGWIGKVGPTILAGQLDDVFASVTLPLVSDRHDAREAFTLLARLVPELADPAWAVE